MRLADLEGLLVLGEDGDEANEDREPPRRAQVDPALPRAHAIIHQT